ncbi:MAG: phosphoglycerate kinase, partial [Candidatus Cloacimonadaceae bacterium]|nr:phosphoglycerate kinase [Candidatus Cloacimonadaceae bacterium]
MARKFLADVKGYEERIIELPFIIESDALDSIDSTRIRELKDLKPGTKLNYILDVAPKSFELEEIRSIYQDSKAIFVNAVMGLTPLFGEGTKAMYKLIDANQSAQKLFGGGDTIQDFKELLPGVFAKAVNDPKYYFFTGGGAILDAIEQGSPFKMKPVQALIKD